MATIYEDPLYAEKLAESWDSPESPILEKGEKHAQFTDAPPTADAAVGARDESSFQLADQCPISSTIGSGLRTQRRLHTPSP